MVRQKEKDHLDFIRLQMKNKPPAFDCEKSVEGSMMLSKWMNQRKMQKSSSNQRVLIAFEG